jgi:hypothetical protein
MSRGSFVTFGSPYSKDWARDEFYRKQDTERAENDRTERATHWLAARLVGKRFDSLEQLRAAVLNVATTLYNGGMDEGTERCLNRAIVALWIGKVERALWSERAIRAEVTEQPRSVRFVA